jgi:hypothetical protein
MIESNKCDRTQEREKVKKAHRLALGGGVQVYDLHIPRGAQERHLLLDQLLQQTLPLEPAWTVRVSAAASPVSPSQ